MEVVMPQVRLSMRKLHGVLRLKWECGFDVRAIARSYSIFHSTVIEHLRCAAEAGLTRPLSEQLDEDHLFQQLFPRLSPLSSRIIPQPDWEYIHKELRHKVVILFACCG